MLSYRFHSVILENISMEQGYNEETQRDKNV